MKAILKFRYARTALAITIFLERELNQPILVYGTPVVSIIGLAFARHYKKLFQDSLIVPFHGNI